MKAHMNSNIKYANQRLYTDVIPYEIINKTDKVILIRKMDTVLIKDKSPYPNNYDYFPCESNPVIEIKQNKDGIWIDDDKIKYNLDDKPLKYYDYGF